MKLTPEQDFEILRARSVYERILAVYSSPFSSGHLREQILWLLFRATHVGASTALITRSGILAWIQAQIALKDGNGESLNSLAARMYETCDKVKVDQWNDGGVENLIKQMSNK